MSDVSRETREVFGARLPLAERFADLLGTAGVERGLIGPRETDRLWERHLLNCAVVTDAVAEASSVADVGSGAGLPGLVWAIRRPDLRVTLIEPLLRRTTFLEEVVAELGLERVTVVRARAEDVVGTFDVVTARAVARLEKLLGWCWPLVGERGELLALKGSSAADEVREAEHLWTRLGVRSASVEEYGADWVSPATTVVRLTR